MFITDKRTIIYPPCSRDPDLVYDTFQWLKDFQHFEGIDIYDQMLTNYQLNRIEWELEGTE